MSEATRKPTLRVHVVALDDGRLLGTLIRTRESFFDTFPPSAYGPTLEDVLGQLDVDLRRLLAVREDELDRYLFTEALGVRTVKLEVHPATMIRKQTVVGRRTVPLEMSFVHGEMKGGIHRVMLPRWRFWLLLEDLDTAEDAVGQLVASALLGEDAAWIYELRRQGEERVEAWAPPWLDSFREPEAAPDGDDAAAIPMPAVEAVAEDWVARAATKKLRPVVGADARFEAEAPRFAGSPAPSVLLVGEPGVGKSTFVRRLARQLLRWRREKREAPRRLWATSADRILAGMIYLGQWQQRCLQMIDELEGERQYLYLGSLLPVLAAQSDGSSIADLFEASVASGAIPVIAECTPGELVAARRRAPRFVDAFQIVRFEEPARAALQGPLSAWAERRGLDLHPAALDRLMRHLGTYSRRERFPGKAFRMIDWLGDHAPKGRIDPLDASRLYAEHVGLPLDLVADERSATTEELAARLREGVIGQDAACAKAAEVLARLKAGLADPERPIGNLLFAGPTGVGKTELAKQLARVLFGSAERLIRVDMSEYMVPGAVERLRQVGRGVESLAQKVHSQPLSLVLFDEIEKAHPEVFDLLLGVLGEGRLTDAMGRLVDFRMTVIVLTSNLGAERGRPLGFEATERSDHARAVRDFFRPELVNRLDHVIGFANLRPEDLRRIVELELAKALKRPGLARRELSLVVSEAARDRLAALGWHPSRGARPLRRTIEERVFTPLAARIAEDPAFRRRRVEVVAGGEPAPEGAIVV